MERRLLRESLRRAPKAPWRGRFHLSLVLLALVAATARAGAQIAPGLDLGGTVSTGGEAERYLRALQLVGVVPMRPWTIQEFTRADGATLAPRGAHPWSRRFAITDSTPRVAFLRPQARVVWNSAFPFQIGAGPTWAGRGVTGEVQAGVGATFGRVDVQLAPVAFLAQNASFPLAPNGQTGDQRFADARFPTSIDAPQRFGDKAYGRVDLGTSSLTVDLPRIAVGLSNAPQRFGPARDYPLVLGPAAGGFPHAFIGTRESVDLWLLKAHARVIMGRLSQTDFSPAAPNRSNRTATALVASITPRGLDGLELGGSRFFETHAPIALARLRRTLSGIIPQAAGAALNITDENQIVSAFFRWAFPTAGFEVYGELYREDYPGDLRRLIEKPDDLTDYTLGFQRTVLRGAGHMRVFRAEFVNGELSPQERGQRGFDYPIPPYTHFELVQGHTQHGLILGAADAFGGAGWRIGVDDFTPSGRRTIGIERALHFDQLPGQPVAYGDAHPDVLYGVRTEFTRFAGSREYGVSLVPAYNINRNLEHGNDRFNLSASASIRGW